MFSATTGEVYKQILLVGRLISWQVFEMFRIQSYGALFHMMPMLIKGWFFLSSPKTFHGMVSQQRYPWIASTTFCGRYDTYLFTENYLIVCRPNCWINSTSRPTQRILEAPARHKVIPRLDSGRPRSPGTISNY